MTKALKWIRKSKGGEDDIGLEEQREEIETLAKDLADETESFDLGIQTGFSTLTRDPSASTTWLDQREDVAEIVKKIRTGEYDYLVAYDDRRICRDDYLSVIKHAATQGGCEFVYVADVAEDDLAYDIHRRVERETKEEEIRKSKAALRRRQEKNYDHGRPRFGMEYDDEGKYQIPGDRIDDVAAILWARATGESYTTITERLDISTGTASRVWERRDWYIKRVSQNAEDSAAIRL
jgi:DNA invertase Pin-like site-specific DNA recombinase